MPQIYDSDPVIGQALDRQSFGGPTQLCDLAEKLRSTVSGLYATIGSLARAPGLPSTTPSAHRDPSSRLRAHGHSSDITPQATHARRLRAALGRA